MERKAATREDVTNGKHAVLALERQLQLLEHVMQTQSHVEKHRWTRPSLQRVFHPFDYPPS